MYDFLSVGRRLFYLTYIHTYIHTYYIHKSFDCTLITKIYKIPFLSYLALNNIVTLKSGSEVIQTGTICKLGCGFLFALYSNYGAILYRLRDIASYWSKVTKKFIPHL